MSIRYPPVLCPKVIQSPWLNQKHVIHPKENGGSDFLELSQEKIFEREVSEGCFSKQK